MHQRGDSLSFAVFAFAVEDMNERDLLMTSATPSALLQLVSNSQIEAGENVLLIAVQLSELHKSGLLPPQSFKLLCVSSILVGRATYVS